MTWPPEFSLDQEKILNLLTGDRFYSNPSAALREAILNAIDATHRHRQIDSNVLPKIHVTFNKETLILKVVDNGVGMSKAEVSTLFAKIGASAAAEEEKKGSVGEFGIGVISYFMAGDTFDLQTYDGKSSPIGLAFNRNMLSGGGSVELQATQDLQGTTVTIHIRNLDTFNVLLESFSYWCHDVEGLSAQLLPDGRMLAQKGASKSTKLQDVNLPDWVERAHLKPVSDPTGWEAMTGISAIAVLYRGVFVQEFEIKHLWGIEGSIDVDPKYFKPRLNRESFVEGQFQTEVTAFLKQCHPVILEALVKQLKAAVDRGILDKWTEKKWANLWLSLPREQNYTRIIQLWDSIFRSLPTFELADGNLWKPASFENIKALKTKVFVASLSNQKSSDVEQAALRLLRNTGKAVIRGIRFDNSWIRYANRSFSTTADLISSVFAQELPQLVSIATEAEQILTEIKPVSALFTGPPAVDLVKLGPDSFPVIRLQDRLIVNIDHEAGKALVKDVLETNNGPMSLVESAARNAYEQLTQVARVVRGITTEPEILGPIRRRFIRGLLS
ncbi:MAG: ATP-binding protein [Gammaproteobacteria bacterium]|nr:ATP-binding protein [Gammaproteobacteria bacterium]